MSRDATPYAQMTGAGSPAHVRRGAPRRMMRQPSTEAEIYRWHRHFMWGLDPEVHESEPQVGWFQMRLVTGGPFVPVAIWLDQEIEAETGELAADEVLRCTVNGFNKDPNDVWLRCCKAPISREEFEALQRRQNEVGAPDPLKKVNLMKAAVGPNG